MFRALIAAIAAGLFFSYQIHSGEASPADAFNAAEKDLSSGDATKRAAAEKAILAAMDAALAKAADLECDMETTAGGQQMSKQRVQARPSERKFRATESASGGEGTEYIGDGTFIWLVSKANGATFVQKFSEQTFTDLGGLNLPYPHLITRELRARQSITAVKADKLNGEPVHVIECERKSNSELSAELLGAEVGKNDVRTKIYVADADGLARKVEITDASGKEQSTTTFTNVKFVKKHADSIFAFTPPKEAMLVDMSSPEGIKNSIKSALEQDAKGGL